MQQPWACCSGKLTAPRLLAGMCRALVWDAALPVSPLSVFAAHRSVLDDFLHEALTEALSALLHIPQVLGGILLSFASFRQSLAPCLRCLAPFLSFKFVRASLEIWSCV
jgi:hypothetical protein